MGLTATQIAAIEHVLISAANGSIKSANIDGRNVTARDLREYLALLEYGDASRSNFVLQKCKPPGTVYVSSTT